MGPGEIIANRFEIQALAGRGGMGVVYRSLDRRSGEAVALKVLREGQSRASKRFLREARLLAELDHPHIVRYIAHGQTPSGEPYLAMEWLEGEDLSDYLKRERFSLSQVVSLITRVAAALGVAHEKGILHRDIKPDNLFLPHKDPEKVKILDFGLARVKHASQSITDPGAFVGTPAYVSPEQAQGAKVIDGRADIFSLGCTFFECLSGRPPFGDDNLMAVLLKTLFEEAPRLSTLRQDIPKPLDDLLARMLEKEPTARPVPEEVVQILSSLAGLSLERHSASPSPAPSAALTQSEQRFLCVVLAKRVLSGDSPGQELEREAARHGGKLSPLVDGSVAVAFLGGLTTDQAKQAAQYALALRRRFPLAPISLAIGRGQALLSRGHGSPAPVGEVIDRVTRLMQESPSQGIWLDELSAELLGARFEMSRGEGGLELRAERRSLDEGRNLLGRPRSCVGRERELASLEASFADCVEEPLARAVLLCAPAGTGKSRLRHELLQKIKSPKPLLLFGQGDPVRAGSPLGLLASALRQECGILEDEPPALQHRKLKARLGQLSLPDLRRLAEFLGELLGAPSPEASAELEAARQEARQMGKEIQRAFLDWLFAETETRPVILVLEDLHWGDLSTITLVDAALDRLRERPLFVLGKARPEVRELFPRLWSQRAFEEIALQRLTKRACEKLIREVLGEVSPEVVGHLYARSEGNAFYLEELIRAVAMGRGDELPETVLAMAGARLERLSPAERQLLRAASIFGGAFWRGSVEALLGGEVSGDLGEILEALDTQEEVIRRRPESRLSGEEEFSFRHELLREAAYAMLTEEDRRLGHKLAGAWLSQHGEQDAASLAGHFERGGELPLAVAQYRRAADQALRGADFDAALARFKDAIRCGARGEELGVLRLIEADISWWRVSPQSAEQSFLAALPELSPGSIHWCKAVGSLVMLSLQLGKQEQLLELIRSLQQVEPAPEAMGLYSSNTWAIVLAMSLGGAFSIAEDALERAEARAQKLPAVDPLVSGWLSVSRCCLAELRDALPYRRLRYAEEAVAHFDALDEGRVGSMPMAGRIMSLHELAFGYQGLGRWSEAIAAWRRSQALASQIGSMGLTLISQISLAEVLLEAGDLTEARRLGEEADEATQANAFVNQQQQGTSRMKLAHILLCSGELFRAEELARDAAERFLLVPTYRVLALGRLGQILLARGLAKEALAAVEEARALAGSTGIRCGDLLVALVRGEALLSLGAPLAEGALVEARDLLLSRAGTIEGPALKESFLKIPEHARILSLVPRA